MKKFIVRKIPVVIAIAAAGFLLFSGLVMLLWNNILPAVLHVSAITLWQAAGILLLSKILFSGFRRRNHMSGGHFKRKMFMKWHSMSPEEKQRMYAFGCRYNHYTQHSTSDTMEHPIA